MGFLIGKVKEGPQFKWYLRGSGRMIGFQSSEKGERSTGQEIGAQVDELTLMHLASAFPGLPHSVLIIILGDKNPISSCYR